MMHDATSGFFLFKTCSEIFLPAQLYGIRNFTHDYLIAYPLPRRNQVVMFKAEHPDGPCCYCHK
jgi:hypothetical protein